VAEFSAALCIFGRVINHFFLTPTLTLYRSSAGSGKTRTLAKEYIKLALAGRGDSFRHILAVTFANKATQEMKQRIVEYLADFASGKSNNLSAEVATELNLTPQMLRQRSAEVLAAILHQYSQFNISTIDAFFQRVIRAFTREAGLLGNFRLEVDNDLVLQEVVAALLDELGPEHPELTKWIIQFSKNELQEGKNWNIQRALVGFAKEVLKEEFKQVEADVMQADAARHRENLATLQAEVNRIKQFMKERADRALAALEQHGLGVDDFWFGDRGTAYRYFREFANMDTYPHEGAYMQKYLADSKNWAGKTSKNAAPLIRLADTVLLPLLREMVAYEEKHGIRRRTAEAIMRNYFSFGLIADITRKLRDYKIENNVMLLADAPRFLNGIIQDSDTPFIYEKVGSWFRNYLIDEFQDTSRFQWQNFVPLLKEASDQQLDNLIVGDVKQSIYRWRGGDLQILQHEVVEQFGADRVEPRALATNYRSAGRIVAFNNAFFKAAADLVQQTVQDPLPADVYSDVAQQSAKWPEQGFVHLRFFKQADGDWEEAALQALPGWLEELQRQNVPLHDIAILVRKNSEGQRVANYLLQYQHSPDAKPGFKYDVVSNESLRLDTAWSINVLISALCVLKNPADRIARTQLVFELNRHRAASEVFAHAQRNELAGLLPAEFILQARFLTKLSVFELTEELIRLFNLGTRPEELAYLQAFQDLVLEFSARERTDLVAFLEWWELNKEKKSIQVSDATEAVSILTVHKSKGLQFKYVIIPFCSWKLGHERSPLLWVTANDPAFAALGPVAVTYSASLEQTLFAEAYRQERTKIYLDSLNMLYVAFTRAEAGLIVFAPEPVRGDLSTVAHVAHRVVQQQPELAAAWDGTRIEIGKLEPLEVHSEANPESVQLLQYLSSDWRKKLVIKRQGQEFFDAAVSDKRTKINTGILLHQVLARLHQASEWGSVREIFFEECVLPDAVREQLDAQVAALLHHPVAATWFTKEWTVATEAPVLLPGGRSIRIDRFITNKKKAVLIDYKTGEKKASDRAQISEYLEVVRQMGWPDAKAYLVYLQPLHIETVTSSSTLSLFE
jgi:ATP-dependent exoDNAse (exonuclease V) beta subunit